jgi:CRP/FNR family transcriptional regulator
MSMLDDLTSLYPAVAALPPDLRASTLRTELQVLEVEAGTALFEEHRPCAGFPFVLAGEVRVARGSMQGRSIELYRVTPGEVCIVSASCLFGHRLLTAQGSTTLPSRLAVLSAAGFEQWVAHEPFRRYMFGLFADRLADVIELAEAVAFQRLDQRLAAALLGHPSPLQVTHQVLADELGTVREIVTRLLRRFERAGWLELGRERIELREPASLRALAAGDTSRR